MRITVIGSGNVATHLAAAFKNAGHTIVQIYSRNIQNASLLAYHVKAEAVDSLDGLTADTDLFVIAVNDDAIPTIAYQLAPFNKLIVHTSGATDLQALLKYTQIAGVFYPLQTFSKTKEIDFTTVPVCLEGADEQITQLLEDLAKTVTRHIYRIDSDQRKTLHLAAVFACNFPNYLYYISSQLLQRQNLPFNLLRPLILETAQKVQEHLPLAVQTGPAIRNDEKTMAAHLQLLKGNPELQRLYRQLSQDIIKMGIAPYGHE